MLREMGGAQAVRARQAERSTREALRDEFGAQPNRINPEYTEYVRGQVERGAYQPAPGPSAAERAAPFMREREMRRLGVSGGQMAELEGLRREIDPEAARRAALPDIQRDTAAQLEASRERSGVFDALARRMEREPGLRDQARAMTDGAPARISASDARSLLGGGGGVEGGVPVVNAAATPAPPPPTYLPNPNPEGRMAFDQAMERERRRTAQMANASRLGEAREQVASLDAERAARERRETMMADAAAERPGLENDLLRLEGELARAGLAPQAPEAQVDPGVAAYAQIAGTTPEIAGVIEQGLIDDWGKIVNLGPSQYIGLGDLSHMAEGSAVRSVRSRVDALEAAPPDQASIVAKNLIAKLDAAGLWNRDVMSFGANDELRALESRLQAIASGGAETFAQR